MLEIVLPKVRQGINDIGNNIVQEECRCSNDYALAHVSKKSILLRACSIDYFKFILQYLPSYWPIATKIRKNLYKAILIYTKVRRKAGIYR